MPRRRQDSKRVSKLQGSKSKGKDQGGLHSDAERKQEVINVAKEKKVEEQKVEDQAPETKKEFGVEIKPRFGGGVEKPPMVR